MPPFTNLTTRLPSFVGSEDGQGLTEYALILALIALVTVGALAVLGGNVTSALSSVGSSV
jgi:pilus assembly protein Flp/PilA